MGCDRAEPRQRDLDHTRETKAHAYADGLIKGSRVALYVTETSGGACPALDLTLRRLGKLATAQGTVDFTQYGASRSAPRSFYAHHAAALSSAIVTAVAETHLNAAAADSFRYTLGF